MVWTILQYEVNQTTYLIILTLTLGRAVDMVVPKTINHFGSTVPYGIND